MKCFFKCLPNSIVLWLHPLFVLSGSYKNIQLFTTAKEKLKKSKKKEEKVRKNNLKFHKMAKNCQFLSHTCWHEHCLAYIWQVGQINACQLLPETAAVSCKLFSAFYCKSWHFNVCLKQNFK